MDKDWTKRMKASQLLKCTFQFLSIGSATRTMVRQNKSTVMEPICKRERWSLIFSAQSKDSGNTLFHQQSSVSMISWCRAYSQLLSEHPADSKHYCL